MNINMDIPGLKGVIIEKCEQQQERIVLHGYLERYTSMSSELKEAHELKEVYKEWQRTSKKGKDISVIMAGLESFYRKVEETGNTAFLKAIKTFKNWQVEILNSYVFGY